MLLHQGEIYFRSHEIPDITAPLKTFNTRLPGLAKGTEGSWWQGKARVASKQVCTRALPRAPPNLIRPTIHTTYTGTTASFPQPLLSKTTSEMTLKEKKNKSQRPYLSGQEKISSSAPEACGICLNNQHCQEKSLFVVVHGRLGTHLPREERFSPTFYRAYPKSGLCKGIKKKP